MRILISILFILFALHTIAQQPDRNALLIDAYGNYLNKSYREAVTSFDRLIKSEDMSKPEWYLYKAIAEFNLGSTDQAKADVEKAVSAGYAEAYIWKARLAILTGDQKQAIINIEKYLRSSKNPDAPSIKKDTLFTVLHNTQEWFALWQDDWQNDDQNTEDEVHFLLKKNQLERAVIMVDEALALHPDDPELHALKSELYRHDNNPQLALNEINLALNSEPDNLVYLKRKADCLIDLSDYASSLNVLNEILFHSPEDFDARYLRARTAMNAGNYSAAMEDIKLYLRYFPVDEAQFLAGQICYAAGRYLESLKYFNPLLEKDKSKASYFKARGMTYYQTGTYKEAAYDLSMSLDLLPNDAEANYFLGLAEQKLGHDKLACYYFTRARNFGDKRAETSLKGVCAE